MLDYFPLPQGAYPSGRTGTVGGWAISSWFGGRPNPFTGAPSWHGGEDIVCPRSTPLYAPLSGRVAQSWDSSGGGWWTTIYADDGRRFGMGHAERYAPGVNGRHVNAGELVAWADSSGASTGNHLHFAMALTAAGPWQDPYDELQAAAAAGRFVGPRHEAPAGLPDPATIDRPATPDPRKALITMQYWKIAGEPAFYRVDVEPWLSPDARDRDGNPANPDRFVGGAYAYAFPGPATFTLDAGIGVSPIELDPDNPDHAPLVEELRKLPLIAQAT